MCVVKAFSTDMWHASSVFSFQDDLEVHYFGLKIPRIHNLTDLVQEYMGPQVCDIFMPLFCYISRKNFQRKYLSYYLS